MGEDLEQIDGLHPSYVLRLGGEGMSVSEIRCADDLAALASEAVQQVRMHKQYRDLIGAILMANHVADWYYSKDLGQLFGTLQKETMKASYPEWGILRKLANGTKHCKTLDKQDHLQWEHTDFWNSPGHLEEDWLDWFVDFEGQPRSVVVLIETFLEKFADRSSRPELVHTQGKHTQRQIYIN